MAKLHNPLNTYTAVLVTPRAYLAQLEASFSSRNPFYIFVSVEDQPKPGQTVSELK